MKIDACAYMDPPFDFKLQVLVSDGKKSKIKFIPRGGGGGLMPVLSLCPFVENFITFPSNSHWSVIEHRTRKQDIEPGK